VATQHQLGKHSPVHLGCLLVLDLLWAFSVHSFQLHHQQQRERLLMQLNSTSQKQPGLEGGMMIMECLCWPGGGEHTLSQAASAHRAFICRQLFYFDIASSSTKLQQQHAVVLMMHVLQTY